MLLVQHKVAPYHLNKSSIICLQADKFGAKCRDRFQIIAFKHIIQHQTAIYHLMWESLRLSKGETRHQALIQILAAMNNPY